MSFERTLRCKKLNILFKTLVVEMLSSTHLSIQIRYSKMEELGSDNVQ